MAPPSSYTFDDCDKSTASSPSQMSSEMSNSSSKRSVVMISDGLSLDTFVNKIVQEDLQYIINIKQS